MSLSSKLVEILPPGITKLMTEILKESFVLTLIGGSVRDFIISGKLSMDLDFELGHINEYGQEEWIILLDKFEHLLIGHGFDVIKNDMFHVYKVTYEGYSLEFASARTENHSLDKEEKGHRDLSVTFHSSIDSALSFKRRDFTCNAIGLKFVHENSKLQVNVEDPFNGITAIENKELVPCHEDFVYDPVRFLRAVRFEVKLGFTLSDKLCEYLEVMNLQKLTNFYYLSEAFKTDFMAFSHRFFTLTKSFKTPLAQRISNLSYLSEFKDAPSLSSKEDVLDYLIESNATAVELESFREFTSMKKSDFRKRVKSARR